MSKNEVVLVDGARTAFTKFCGSFREITATDLGAISAKEAIKRAQINATEVDQVFIGNVMQSSTDAHVIARHVGLKAGVSIPTPCLTVNRLCGSGLESIVQAARLIQTGESQVALAGGAENLSQVPHVIRGARWGLGLGQTGAEDWLWDSFYDSYGDCTMAVTAENLAKQYELTREEVDQHAQLSHARAVSAMDKGYFKEEIAPVTIKKRKGDVVIDTDEHPRNTTIKELSKLEARFVENGVVTAGNASGINDGAAAAVLTSSQYAEKNALKPLARLVSYAVVGVEPKVMGIGPVPAILQALKKAGMRMEDMDLVEINEAFSAQYLACQKELGFDPTIGNVNGGAVALGHPLAASGTRITLSLIRELGRRGKKYGVSSLCIGGGQGIAAIWERL
ncbi:acetyl-CoA C-acetyltransferase [Alkalihalobacillus sp. MEB130]|uniref:acetyl-CoA C-acetyltransferase n=1 Tax=Alkalihalobacillus sp. MEB130 TaxID=2976704 RepID=UPI0028DE5512|nr:acetyl-CoA C-acetyltransferase [Alkalihalobacillus sp. MEB130]MDT8861335.1 acetyl-CoA C-acetyltransferase [Alkalihalobacillus sp. MEB130]